jgi:hypothetical protein
MNNSSDLYMSILSDWEVDAELYTVTHAVARLNYERLPKDQLQYCRQMNCQIILLFGACTIWNSRQCLKFSHIVNFMFSRCAIDQIVNYFLQWKTQQVITMY